MERHAGGRLRPGQSLGRWLALAWAGVGLALAGAQDTTEEEKFAADSLRYRTALHHDPLLDAPMESLVKLYLSAGRTEELIGLYRSHVEQYPNDAGAKTVLFRILRRVDRAGAEELIAAAVPLHPDYAPLQYMLFRFLEDRGDPRATEALSRAIEMETNETRRYEWLDQLLKLSEGEAERTLAQAHFEKWLSPEQLPVETLLGLARLMQRYQFWPSSVTALERARKAATDPETAVEIEMMYALGLARTGKTAEAGKLLDQLLAKLAVSHWRRREILSLRLTVVANPEERAALLAAYRKAYIAQPDRESAALDLAEVLIAAEQQDEAEKVILESSARLPGSVALEKRALEMLEDSGNALRYAGYLTDKLERDPARLDLRFRLVKAEYAIGQDAAAEQDFKSVMAGLAPEEASERILELQRYLRGIDRIDAAASYLDRYVRNHPARLDVARELAEIYLSQGKGENIPGLVRTLQPSAASVEGVLDFTTFLLEQNQVGAARTIVEAKMAGEPRHFELGMQWIEILGRVGDASAAQAAIARFRELTDTAPRYSQWLAAAAAAHRSLESLPGFFESELARYNFSEGKWSADKVDKFLILCETGKQQLFSESVAEGLRQQLKQANLDPNLRLRLRRALVGVLEQDPASASEVEEQLESLAAEDPTRRAEYDLRRALVYHRSQRIDLAQQLVEQIELTDVANVPLLRDATDVLVGYGFLREAETALATITRLEPGDLLSWERRLSLLAALRKEADLRALIRSLRGGETGTTLRDASNRSLDQHLDASYWRSIALLLRGGPGRDAEVLPLLASVERESRLPETPFWSEWTRAFILSRLGRTKEAETSLERLKAIAKSRSMAEIRFPDGLELSLDGATSWLLARQAAAQGPDDTLSADFLLAGPVMRWAFELPDDARILRVEKTGEVILVLDDQHQISALDAASGKLLWRKGFAGRGEARILPPPAAFASFEDPGRLVQRTPPSAVASRLAPTLATNRDRFHLLQGRDLCAYSARDGALLWVAALEPPAADGTSPEGGATATPRFDFAGENLILFDPVRRELHCFAAGDGKLVWKTDLASGDGASNPPAFDLQSGLSLSGGSAFVYGQDSAIVDLASGMVIWRLEASDPPSFPLVLRPRREGEEWVAAADPTGSGQPPNPLQSLEFVDFQSGLGTAPLDAETFGGQGQAALLSPALYWTQTRRQRPDAAHATLSGGALWLMQAGRVRRVSSDLPVASVEMEASGTLIGLAGNHLWFLDGTTLRHLDPTKPSAAQISLEELGAAGDLRATLVGNQILVRGSGSLLLINALTGLPLGRVSFPGALADYLAGFAKAEEAAKVGEAVWQGRIVRTPTDPAGRCLPTSELVAAGLYVTSFDDRRIVALESQAAPAQP